jgi:glycerol uptake facilitator-like aquaporin
LRVATAFPLIGMVGSGIMAQRVGLALLANAIATGGTDPGLRPAFRCALNPAVTLAAALTTGLHWHTVPAYIVALTGYRIMTW